MPRYYLDTLLLMPPLNFSFSALSMQFFTRLVHFLPTGQQTIESNRITKDYFLQNLQTPSYNAKNTLFYFIYNI